MARFIASVGVGNPRSKSTSRASCSARASVAGLYTVSLRRSPLATSRSTIGPTILGPYASSLGPGSLGSRARRRRASSSLSHRPTDLWNRYPRRRASSRTRSARSRFLAAAAADALAPPPGPNPARYMYLLVAFPSRIERTSTPNARSFPSYILAARLLKSFTPKPNARAASEMRTPALPASAHSDTRLSSGRVSSCIQFPPTGFRRGAEKRASSAASSASSALRGAAATAEGIADVRRNASISLTSCLRVFSSVTVVTAVAHAASPRLMSHARARANSLFILFLSLVSSSDHRNAPLALRSVRTSTPMSCLSVIKPSVASGPSSASNRAPPKCGSSLSETMRVSPDAAAAAAASAGAKRARYTTEVLAPRSLFRSLMCASRFPTSPAATMQFTWLCAVLGSVSGGSPFCVHNSLSLESGTPRLAESRDACAAASSRTNLCCCHADSHEAASPSPSATCRTGSGATRVRGFSFSFP
mmetsp:Transcript_1016/g.4295  ORF Transcript_1016/g.4295 Transcript_1016/m.4295 type:complete len:476 (+) Transcript_1016:2459-3886(+)